MPLGCTTEQGSCPSEISSFVADKAKATSKSIHSSVRNKHIDNASEGYIYIYSCPKDPASDLE